MLYNNVLMVFTRPSTFKSSSPFNNPLITVLKATVTTGINVTFMFHRFFSIPLQGRGTYPPFHIIIIIIIIIHKMSESYWRGSRDKQSPKIILAFNFIIIIISIFNKMTD